MYHNKGKIYHLLSNSGTCGAYIHWFELFCINISTRMLFNQHFCWRIDDVRNQSGLTSLSVVGDVLYCLRPPQTPNPENATCDTDKNVVN